MCNVGQYEVGTLEWSRAGGPPLTTWQRLQQYVGAVVEYLHDFPHEIRWVLARRGVLSAAHVREVELPRLPDSAAIRDAEGVLREMGEEYPAVIEHSYRCFYFAALLHELSGCREPMDMELLAGITLLHDVGLFPSSLPGEANEFTVRSASAAREVANRAGWSQDRLDQLAQSITLNANARVPLDKWGPEAHFARLAPIMDIAGQVWKLHPSNAVQIFREHPLGGLASDISQLVNAEADRQPGGRFCAFRPFLVPITKRQSGRWRKFEETN